VSHTLVAELVQASGYSLQANRKMREGPQHPDRDAQFHYILDQVRSFQKRRQPAISVDTKKKELVGDFKNGGREWRAKGTPERVRIHDFIVPEQGKAIPYGVYALHRNEGWASVGIDHDTASLAVNAIRSWWRRMGRPVYARARSLLITGDAGGSNGPRLRLWKWELQRFANRIGLSVSVCHFPPGTSKWKKIEHRLFSTSPPTGVVSHSPAWPSSSASSARQRRPLACGSGPRSTTVLIPKAPLSRTSKWLESTSSLTPSTATGTTRSAPAEADSD
jgi:hypothetical protein